MYIFLQKIALSYSNKSIIQNKNFLRGIFATVARTPSKA